MGSDDLFSLPDRKTETIQRTARWILTLAGVSAAENLRAALALSPSRLYNKNEMIY